MNREQAINYLRSSGMSEEQIKAIVDALEMPYKDAFEDIRDELYRERTNISFNLSEEKAKWTNSGIYDGLVWAEEIIDKHNPDKDRKRWRGMIRIEEVINHLQHCSKWNDKPQKEVLDMVIKALKQEQNWIPMTTRPMTEEEREHYREWSDVEGAMIFDCPLPDDGQEVLISSYGYVCVDTFCSDDGCYFEGVDIDDVEAWMPLPEPYKEGSDADND